MRPTLALPLIVFSFLIPLLQNKHSLGQKSITRTPSPRLGEEPKPITGAVSPWIKPHAHRLSQVTNFYHPLNLWTRKEDGNPQQQKNRHTRAHPRDSKGKGGCRRFYPGQRKVGKWEITGRGSQHSHPHFSCCCGHLDPATKHCQPRLSSWSNQSTLKSVLLHRNHSNKNLLSSTLQLNPSFTINKFFLTPPRHLLRTQQKQLTNYHKKNRKPQARELFMWPIPLTTGHTYLPS